MRPSGGLALLAIDQRESLRTLMAGKGLPSENTDITAFKVLVTSVLSPHASGLLIDPLYGLGAVLDCGALASTCGLIVAADYLIQLPGEPPSESELDESLDLASFVAAGAVGLKLLVLWERDRFRDRRLEMTRTFVARCAELGVLSIVEGIVRGPIDGEWDRDGDVIEAAREFGQLQPDLYKAEVPTLGRGVPMEMERLASGITDALPCPWVALSAGVDADAFPAAIEAVCRGGASGFLAGRGIWAPSIRETDLPSSLVVDAIPRLLALVEIVDRFAGNVSSA
jgi:sulfofructosephosphate aldolase